MTGPGKRLCAAVLLLCVLTGGVLPVKADTQEYRQQLLKAYSSSPEGSSATIETCLEALEAESPAQGAMWRQIMFDWNRLNHSGFASSRSLQEGLAQDDSLCIVVFGYGLNRDGSMKPELFDRLNVALQAARQYPNAYIDRGRDIRGQGYLRSGGHGNLADEQRHLRGKNYSRKEVPEHHGKREIYLRAFEPEVPGGKAAGGCDQ